MEKTWGRQDGFANVLKFVTFLNRGVWRFLKKFTEGNARNSINCADVTKIRKTRVARGRMSKIRVRAITLACA